MRLLKQFIALHQREGLGRTLPLLAFLFSGILTTFLACYLFYQNEEKHSQSQFNNKASNILWNLEHEIHRVQYYLKTVRSHFEEMETLDQEQVSKFTYPYLKHEPQVLGITWQPLTATSINAPRTTIRSENDKKSIFFDEPIYDQNNTLKGHISLELSPNILINNLKDYLHSDLNITAFISGSNDQVLYQSSNKPLLITASGIAPSAFVDHTFPINNSEWVVQAQPHVGYIEYDNTAIYLFGLLFSGIAITCITFLYLVKSAVRKHEVERIVIRKTEALQYSNQQLEEQKSTIMAMLERAKVDRKLAEKARDLKSNFLSVMSHEIRTPLNAVIGFTHMLEEKITDPNLTPHIQGLAFSGKTLLTLVNDILDLSKIEHGKLVPEHVNFDLSQLLESVIATHMALFHEKKLNCFTSISQHTPLNLIGDPFRLTQIFNNLISNAIKFTNEGEIEVSIDLIQQQGDNITIRFEVRDTGIGISKNRIDTIFERFEQADTSITRKYGGTGLGLNITKKIIEALGGSIKVASHVQVGSTFTFDLPYQIYTEEHTHPLQSSSNENCLKEMRVLLVDDNPINLLIAKNYLSNWQMHIETASNGQEAIVAAQANTYDVILMDLHMPVLDGYTASSVIKQDSINLNTPVFALTADTYHEDKEKLHKAGFEGLIPKPIDPDKLKHTLETVAQRAANTYTQ